MSALPWSPVYTVADYEQWEGDWELWRGRAVWMSPSPVPAHQLLQMRLGRILGDLLDANGTCDCAVVAGLDWQAEPDTILRPDLMIACRGFGEKRLEARPELIIEILSEATREYDRRGKLALYRDNGVPHYFVIDPATRLLERLLGDEAADSPEEVVAPLHDGCTLRLPRRIDP